MQFLYIKKRVLNFAYFLLAMYFILLIVFGALAYIGCEFGKGKSVVFNLIILLLIVCLGGFLIVLGFATVYENQQRRLNGRRSIGMNKHGSWQGGGFYFNQFINLSYALMGLSILLFSCYVAVSLF